jgi:hypothetical protein
MVINAQTGLITWIPDIAQLGNLSITVSVSDGKVSTSQSFKIIVIKELPPINYKPVITQTSNKTVMVGDVLGFPVDAIDADAGDVLTYTLEGAPSGMTISSDGVIIWTPSKNQVGKHTITVNVTDGKAYSTAQFTVTVEKKSVPRTTIGLGSMVLGAIAAIVIAIVIILVAVMATRGRRREEPVVAKKREKAVEPPGPSKKAPSRVEETPKPIGPIKAEAKPKIAAKLKDEIDLDDLDDED